MIPRLTVCFGLSVLLHGMLLLSVAPASRPGGRGNPPVGSPETKKMLVFLEASPGKAKASEDMTGVKSSGKLEAVSSAPVKPAAIRLPPFVSPAQPESGPGWLVQPPSGSRDAQISYQQMYEMQARLQAMQQVQMFISRLQADIEQSINLRGEPATGRCGWQGDSPVFQCDSESLQRQMQTEADRLLALRNAMKTQGSILDGFTVGSSGDRSTISYQVHSAATEPAL